MTNIFQLFVLDLDGKREEVYKYFDRKDESLVEIASGPNRGQVFYVKTNLLKDIYANR